MNLEEDRDAFFYGGVLSKTESTPPANSANSANYEQKTKSTPPLLI